MKNLNQEIQRFTDAQEVFDVEDLNQLSFRFNSL